MIVTADVIFASLETRKYAQHGDPEIARRRVRNSLQRERSKAQGARRRWRTRETPLSTLEHPHRTHSPPRPLAEQSLTMVHSLASVLVLSAVLLREDSFLFSHALSVTPSSKRLKQSDYDTIASGRIAVMPDFLPPSEIAALKRDASSLWNDHLFSTDALASYGTSGNFDPSKDRAVLKLKQWKNANLGNFETRQLFGARMQELRADLAYNLNRPRLTQGESVTKYGSGSTEISYTRFGPGAYLKRHVDEHHEELKGTAGWEQPTRRSLSWLIYLNEDWNANVDGGCLRCYERAARTARIVGARRDGDLQIGWLRPTLGDPYERPVFMDAQRPGKDGHCAMYVDGDGNTVEYISKDFNAHPTLFVAGSELLAQKTLIANSETASRFHFIEPPKSKLNDFLASVSPNSDDETPKDIEPTAGTLVVFDSVSLPHEVLATTNKERWATSGWFHEDQQPVEGHPHYKNA